jgi:hypothetical protein
MALATDRNESEEWCCRTVWTRLGINNKISGGGRAYQYVIGDRVRDDRSEESVSPQIPVLQITARAAIDELSRTVYRGAQEEGLLFKNVNLVMTGSGLVSAPYIFPIGQKFDGIREERST